MSTHNIQAILMSTHNIHLKYRTLKRYPTIIFIVPPGVALIVIFRGSNYRCLEQIFMVPKGFEPSKSDCILFQDQEGHHFYFLLLLFCCFWGSIVYN